MIIEKISALFSKWANREQVLELEDRTEWRKGGELHRDNAPAVVHLDGTKEWWCEGERHRVEGAAIERDCGCKSYYIRGQLCKSEGEAGTKIYAPALAKIFDI